MCLEWEWLGPQERADVCKVQVENGACPVVEGQPGVQPAEQGKGHQTAWAGSEAAHREERSALFTARAARWDGHLLPADDVSEGNFFPHKT